MKQIVGDITGRIRKRNIRFPEGILQIEVRFKVLAGRS